MRLLTPPEVRVAWWALRALRHVRGALRDGGDVFGADVAPAAPPDLRPVLTATQASRVADAVLTRTHATCLERALVEQRLQLRWDIARDVVIGVRGPSHAFAAHAWLDGAPDDGYLELTRRPARG